MEIREISAGDAEQLSALFETLASDPSAEFFRPHPLTADYARELVDGVQARRDRYFVAVEPGGFTGYGMLRGWDEGYQVPAFGVAVAPEARGHGVGRKLLRYALELARASHAPSVMLKVHPDNVDARHLYESEGFVFESLADDGIQLKGVRPLVYE